MSKNQETLIANAIIVAIQKKYGDKVWVHKNVVAKAKLASGFFANVGLGVGSADIIVCFKGRLIGFEVKTPEGKLSEEQVKWGKMLRVTGGVFECVRCIQDALSVLDRLDKDAYSPTYFG